MLIAIATFLVIHFGLGGAGVLDVARTIAALEEIVDDKIADGPRKDEMLVVVEEMRLEYSGFLQVAMGLRAKAMSVELKYVADETQFRSILDDLARNWDTSSERLVDLRFRLRDLMTEAEWNDVFQELREKAGFAK